MTRREANDLYGWLRDTYPRNYATADERRVATVIDNLARVFANNSFKEVLDEYQRAYTYQKTEPHPSEIRAALKGETKKRTAKATDDPVTALRRQPGWDMLCQAYGEREVIRQAKCCVETASMGELRFRLERDQ